MMDEAIASAELTEPFEAPHKPEELDLILSDSSIKKLEDLNIMHEAIAVDNFWVEIAEHFKAIAKLCEERSRNGK